MAKVQKKSYHVGDVEKFNKTLEYAQRSGETFKTITSGLSRKIVLSNGLKLNYFGHQGKNNLIDGAFLVRMVQRDIDAFIEQHGQLPMIKPSIVQTFNHNAIKRVLSSERTPIIGIDINSCYWVTAHHLGYISDDLFQRGLSTCKKKGLLIAIGCLNKLPMIKHYENGQLKFTSFDDEYNQRYAPFYWRIIRYTHEILIKSFETFQDDWFMWLTDCVFVSADKVQEAQKLLTSFGYNVKTHTIEFKKFENYNLEWFDFKDQKIKTMHTGRRDIHYYYPLWKAEGAEKSAPPTN